MKKNIITISILFCSLNITYSQGWYTISDPLLSPNSIWSVYFLNELTGYIAAHDNTQTYSILKTTNGGYNWVIQVSGNNAKCPYAVCFTNEYTGFAVGGDPWGFVSSILYKTTNSGDNWLATNLPETLIYRAIRFIDPNTGYIAGAYGHIRRTINSGSNWELIQSNTNFHLRSIFFTNIQTGYICGSSGIILKTIDGGTTWISLNSSVTQGLYSIYFVNSMTGFAVGDEDQISVAIKTTNAGIDWSILNLGINFRYLQSVYFIDNNTGYVGGHVGVNSAVARTTNSGLNWVGQDASGGSIAKNIFFFNSNSGISSAYHYILRTTNSGFGAPNPPTNLSIIYLGNFRYRLTWNDNSISEAGYKTEMKTNIDTTWVIRNVTQPNITSIVDSGLVIGPIYYFRNYSFNNYGNSNYSNVVSISLVSILQISNNVPEKFSLGKNYPNPFNPVTKIEFQIPKLSEAKIIVYDAIGREIQTLINEQLSPGTYEVEFDGTNYSSGVYYYQLTVEQSTQIFTQSRRMLLIK